MKKKILFSLLLFAVLSGVFFSLNSGAGEVITEDKLREMIGEKSHSVMAKQLDRIHEVLEGFLTGDWQRIQTPLYQMRQDIDKIGNQYLPYADKNIPALQALDAMRKDTTTLQVDLEAKDYEKAYKHFHAMTYHCIQCHQAQREWGKFEKVKEEGKEKKASSTSEAKKEGGAKENAPPAKAAVSKAAYA